MATHIVSPSMAGRHGNPRRWLRPERRGVGRPAWSVVLGSTWGMPRSVRVTEIQTVRWNVTIYVNVDVNGYSGGSSIATLAQRDYT